MKRFWSNLQIPQKQNVSSAWKSTMTPSIQKYGDTARLNAKIRYALPVIYDSLPALNVP